MEIFYSITYSVFILKLSTIINFYLHKVHIEPGYIGKSMAG